MHSSATTIEPTNPNWLWSAGSHCLQLDGVRGLAILLVTIYRFAKEIPTNGSFGNLAARVIEVGDRGVDLFFVLSGFLITNVLIESRQINNYFGRFYWRRSLRIFPLYFLTLLTLLVLLPWLTGSLVFQQAQREQFYLWTYLANIRMSYLGQWCFGGLDHFWSLAVEEHFYFVWPIVVLLLSSRRALQVACFIAAAAVVSRIGFVALGANRVAADVLTMFRVEGLCLGAAVAFWVRTRPNILSRRALLLALLLGLLTLGVLADMSGKGLLTVPHAVWALTWSVFILWLVSSAPESRIAYWMSASPLRMLGKYSYAMYVFQSPLLHLLAPVFSMTLCISWFGGSVVWGVVGYVAAMFAATLSLAWLSWHCLEKHCLKLKELKLNWFKAAAGPPLSVTSSIPSSLN
jgi:peptidoglycan/LPS O-acetylase OafA/YrhL